MKSKSTSPWPLLKSIVSLILPLVGCGLGFLALFTGPQMLAGKPGDDNGPSPCLSEAVIHVNADPAQITFGGKPSVISWSVSLPAQCGTVQVKLNGALVARSGSRSVSPSRS